MDGFTIKKTILDVVRELEPQGPGMFQQGSVLNECVKRLSMRDGDSQRALLTYWHDLFRTGYLAWGYNLSNPNPPFLHITERGRNILKNLSRDPSNPEGYLEYLERETELNPIAYSYLKEALDTFNQECYKAASVMVGAASESMVLELRDIFVDKMTELNKDIPRQLNDWRIKTVFDQIEKELNSVKREIPHNLRERYESLWSSFFTIIRMTRNEAGHPTSVEPVTFDLVHSNLLMFPELAKLVGNIREWVKDNYQ